VWGFEKDELHILSMAITLKNLKEQIRTVTANTNILNCRMFGMELYILMCTGQQMKDILTLCRVS